MIESGATKLKKIGWLKDDYVYPLNGAKDILQYKHLQTFMDDYNKMD